MPTSRPTALFSISSLGLGHATRTLPLIRHYLPTHDIHIVSTGNALSFLKKELGETAAHGTKVTFHECVDYPPLERGTGLKFHQYLVTDSIKTLGIIRREHAFIVELAKRIKPAFIISDGRYGSYVKGIPSFIISHQIAFIMPRGFKIFGNIADLFNRRTFNKFDALFIPDYPHAEENLSGSLAHHSTLKHIKHHHVGILSSLTQEGQATLAKDIDYLFTISGYLNEHRPAFIDGLVAQARKLAGKKVFVLGRPDEGETPQEIGDGVTLYPSAAGALRDSLFKRAKFIISRSGYTTVMDLVELGTPGLLVPTPGQTEQEYLADRFARNGYFLTIPNGSFEIERLLRAKAPSSFVPPWKTGDSVKEFVTIIDTYR